MPVGGVAEWSNAPVLKTDVGESLPWVRIPPPPPVWHCREFELVALGGIFLLFCWPYLQFGFVLSFFR